MTVDRRAVLSVAKSDAADRTRLLRQWEEEFSQGRQREQERRAFEAEQLAKGLVKYRGGWISPHELALVAARQQLDEARRREAQAQRERDEEAQRLTARISELEAEQRRLELRLAQATRPVVVPSPWLIHQWPVRHLSGPALLRDEQGNLLRRRRHDGHDYVVAPDGRHLDLQPHDGHLAMTDEHGEHHDVHPVARRWPQGVVIHGSE